MKKSIQAPDWLNPLAKIEWDRVVASGHETGGATGEALLAAYCQNYARWVEAEKLLAENGTEIIIRDDKGIVKNVLVSPQIGISTKALDRMVKCAAQLGLRANLAPAPSKAAPAVKRTAAADAWFGGVN